MRVTIRKMEEKDLAEAFKIIKNVVDEFNIEPRKALYEEIPRFMEAVWSSYYYFEPRACFVAERDGKFIGFIFGCSDTRLYQRFLLKNYSPKLLKVLEREITISKRLIKSILCHMIELIISILTGNVFTSPVSYPAHFHIDIDSGYRGKGAGTKLLNCFFDYLKRKGVYGIHLQTSSLLKDAVEYYKKRFKLYKKQRDLTELFFTGKDAYFLTYIKSISQTFLSTDRKEV